MDSITAAEVGIALATLAAADAVIAEDTRVTKILLAHYGIATPLVAYHEHNAAVMRPHLIARLQTGAALALVSVWQFVGIPMMLIYAALLSIPDDVIEAAEMDGVTGWSQFWKIKLPLILPSIGIISILTFVGNFNAFDLIYVAQGALAGPDYSTDILGTFLYRTFFGFQLQLGDPYMGSAIATAMFGIILLAIAIKIVSSNIGKVVGSDASPAAVESTLEMEAPEVAYPMD